MKTKQKKRYAYFLTGKSGKSQECECQHVLILFEGDKPILLFSMEDIENGECGQFG